jgi:two-component system sensor histidine kinase CpxA
VRSVYARLIAWALATLLVSLAVFVFISRKVEYAEFKNDSGVQKNAYVQYKEAKRAYETQGREALAAYMAAQRATYPNLGFLFLTNGVDPLTGADHHSELRKADSIVVALNPFEAPVFAVPDSASDDVFFITLPKSDLKPYAPYYALLLAAVGVLCWVMTMQLVKPLQALKHAVTLFGSGDFSVRLDMPRRDEIGDVAQAFDEMASRIEQLLAADRRLLQDISHELRSPLARLSFAIELIRNTSDRDAAIARANKEIGRLTSLVASLMDVTRIEVDPQQRRLRSISLDGLVTEVVEDFTPEAGKKGCVLHFAGGEPVHIDAEPDVLRRAIENVVHNAIVYCPPDSAIELLLTTNRVRNTVSLSVRDHGPGVPPEELSRIFLPFFRVDASRAEYSGGVGLGLSIVERALRIHGGTVHAENANPGLIIVLELPMSESPATSQTLLRVADDSRVPSSSQ